MRLTIGSAPASSVSGGGTANSSPPRLATVSSGRRRPAAGGAPAEQLVAGLVAVNVVVGLEDVEVDHQQGHGPLEREEMGERGLGGLGQAAAVQDPGQGVGLGALRLGAPCLMESGLGGRHPAVPRRTEPKARGSPPARGRPGPGPGSRPGDGGDHQRAVQPSMPARRRPRAVPARRSVGSRRRRPAPPSPRWRRWSAGTRSGTRLPWRGSPARAARGWPSGRERRRQRSGRS